MKEKSSLVSVDSLYGYQVACAKINMAFHYHEVVQNALFLIVSFDPVMLVLECPPPDSGFGHLPGSPLGKL